MRKSRARDGMQAAGLLAAARQGHIDGALGEFRSSAACSRRMRCISSAAWIAAFASLMRWPAAGRSAAESVPKLLSCSVSSPFLPKKPHAHLVEGRKARRRVDVRERLLDER